MPPGLNVAPVFTSFGSASIVENSTAVFYTARATDADGDPVTYFISGGADAALFNLTPGGDLSFISPPNFETSRAANSNGQYRVDITASDGKAGVVQDLIVVVQDDTAENLRARRIATGFTNAVSLVAAPDAANGASRVFIVQRTGRISLMNLATQQVTTFLDLSNRIATGGERGVFGIAYNAADFQARGEFYVFATSPGGANELVRYRTTSASNDVGDLNSGQVLVSIPYPASSTNNGGWIGTDPLRGILIATADGGGAGDPAGNAQNPGSLLGKLLSLNRDKGTVSIVAIGLRNPRQFTFYDNNVGDLYIPDQGENFEEINRLTRGLSVVNFGWNKREGVQPYNGAADSQSFTSPSFAYAHGSIGSAIVGGVIYKSNPKLTVPDAVYIFADAATSRVFSVPISAAGGSSADVRSFTPLDIKPDVGTLDNIASFGEDDQGRRYIVCSDGEIFVLEL